MKRNIAILAVVWAALNLAGTIRAAGAREGEDPASKRVRLALGSSSRVDSLKLRVKSVGANYVLDPTVMRGAEQVFVKLSIANQPFTEALDNVLKAASAKGNGLTYRLENGIYTITAGELPHTITPPIPTPNST